MGGSRDRASDEHTVRRFDHELQDLSALVMRMGGLVEEQIGAAMRALRAEDPEQAREVIARDHVVNFMQVQADEQIVNLLALRQPMGRDLRMIMSLGKTVTDLERVGDEAERIARMTIHIYNTPALVPAPRLLRDTGSMSRLAVAMLRDALDALARLDVAQALAIARRDAELDAEFQAALRRLATFILEDPRNVGHTINATFILKSLERIGDHAKNIAEYVVYLVKGKDVRHVSPESLGRDLLESRA
ncbi:MAG: phosphate signaling complex protein PhoU [Ectothiorhodospiraceae bacterium]|nr:phosphate signaling complex protein PhoU [Ectothiorhodospiraceae bacterium]